MGELFQQFLNKAKAKYKEADKATGGWLPGGGVANPLSQVIANPSKTVESIRDKTLVPLIDKGLGAGVIPAREGMFVRFLTGTSQPLNTLPPEVKAAVPSAVQQSSQRERSRDIYREVYNRTFTEEEARLRSAYPILGDSVRISAANAAFQAAKPYTDRTILLPKIDDQGRLDIQYRDYNSENPLKQTLGRFHTKDGQVIDEYNFAMADKEKRLPGGMVIPKTDTGLTGAGLPAVTAFELAKKIGLITNDSGYVINAPYR